VGAVPQRPIPSPTDRHVPRTRVLGVRPRVAPAFAEETSQHVVRHRFTGCGERVPGSEAARFAGRLLTAVTSDSRASKRSHEGEMGRKRGCSTMAAWCRRSWWWGIGPRGPSGDGAVGLRLGETTESGRFRAAGRIVSTAGHPQTVPGAVRGGSGGDLAAWRVGAGDGVRGGEHGGGEGIPVGLPGVQADRVAFEPAVQQPFALQVVVDDAVGGLGGCPQRVMDPGEGLRSGRYPFPACPRYLADSAVLFGACPRSWRCSS
jgi:hypothetical protein